MTRPNNNQQKEENMQNCRLRCPGWPQNKTEIMGKEGQVPRPVKHAGDSYTNCNWCFWHSN